MNSEMTTNNYQQMNLKETTNNENKNYANNYNRNRIREMDIMWRDFNGEGEGRNRGKRYREEEA